MLFEKYLSKVYYNSYDDFYQDCKIIIERNFNFAYDVVDEIARKSPQKTALVWCNEKNDERIFTFQDIRAESCRIAHFLKAYGVQKGDRVLLLLKRRYEFWFCLIALHRIGAIAIPASSLLTAKDISYRINTANVKMVIAADDEYIIHNVEWAESESPFLKHKVLVGGKRDGWIDFNTEYIKMTDFFEHCINTTTNQDIMLIYFTSGTTGLPKMVAHDFTYPLGHIITAKYWQCVQPDKLHFTLAETGWAKAMWGKIYGQWLCDAPIFVYDFERFNAKNLLYVISKYKVATFCAPPTVYRLLFEEDFKKYDLTALEHCSIAGEAYEHRLYEEFYKRTGLKLREAYGQTETTVVLGNFTCMESKPCSMGKPAPGYIVEILNEKGKPCKTGEKGEIVIQADKNIKPIGLFCGYYNDPDYSASVWHDGWYHTGDIAWQDKDGYFWFAGRADNMIKSSGYRIGPFEVESVLLQHPAVYECIVTGVPDIDRGQVVKATIVLRENYKPSRELIKELQDYVKAVTAPYKYPRIIAFVDKISKTFNGKIKH